MPCSYSRARRLQVTFTHQVGDGLESAIIKVTKPTDAKPAATAITPAGRTTPPTCTRLILLSGKMRSRASSPSENNRDAIRPSPGRDQDRPRPTPSRSSPPERFRGNAELGVGFGENHREAGQPRMNGQFDRTSGP